MIYPTIYAVCLIISAILIMLMAAKNYSNIDIYYCAITMIVPVVILGYWLKASSISVESARLAFCIMYLDSTFLPVIMLFSLLKSLKIHAAVWAKTLAYGAAFAHLFLVWFCKDNNLYYTSFSIEKTPLGTVVNVTGGPLKIIHIVFLAAVAVALICIMVECVIKNGLYSKKILFTYGSFILAALVIYILEELLDTGFSLLPVFYTLIDIFISANYEFVHSHDIDCLVIDETKEYSKRGYIAFDKESRLLCYNDIAESYLPEICSLKIDSKIETHSRGNDDSKSALNIIGTLIKDYLDSGTTSTEFTKDDITYRATIIDFYMRKNGRKIGNIIELQDVTAEHAYTNLIKEYSRSLESEVGNQTNRIKYIQNKVVLGMATIIENRDMSTGGHVRRTSDIIKIIIEEMQRQGRDEIDDKFADEVIRSAPMHDLGKISIDNKILCKPGRLTDEEYATMKSHSAKSGEIVKAILSGVEDPHFVNTAYCLARFHHERWDGKGYPEGLMETEIPLEARIMAVADVYDALVSKRCYKKPMSFDEAARIMLEGMGSQFDPDMEPIFIGCREQLEAYYKQSGETEREQEIR